MSTEDELLSKNEFSELIQHLTLQEILTVEFLIDTVWRKLITQVDNVKKLFQCNLCNVVQSGMKNLCAHLDGKRHKAQLEKVLQLYHPDYTHPKSTVNKSSHGSRLQQSQSKSQSKAPTVGKTAIQMNKNVSSTSSNKTSHTTPSFSKPPDSSVNKSTAKVSQQSNTVVTETFPVVRIKTEPKDEDDVEDSDNINAADCKNLTMSANKNIHGNENINNVKITAACLKPTSTGTSNSAPETKPIKLGSCTVRIQRLPANVTYKSTPNNAAATKPSQPRTAKAVKAETIKNSSENMAAKKTQTKDSSSTAAKSPESIINTPLIKNIKQEKPDSIDEKRDNQSPQTGKIQKTKCSSNNTATKTTQNKGSLLQAKSNSDEMNKTQKKGGINSSPKKSGASQIDKSLNEATNKGEDPQNNKDANERNNLKSAESESIEQANTVGGDDANVIKKSNPNENKEKLMTSYKIPVLQGRISVKPVSQLVKNPFALMDENNANDDDGDSNKEKGENKNEPSPTKVIEVRNSPQKSKQQSMPEEDQGNKRSHDNDNTDEPPPQRRWVKSIVLNPAAAYVEKEQNKTNIQYETNKIIVPTKHKSKAGPSAPGNNQPNFTTKSFTCSRADDGEIHGLLGVEYVIKILKSRDDISPRYECGLCELVLDGFAMQKHLEGYNHRLKYCEKHFPTAVRHYRQYLTNVPPYETYKVMTPILSKLAVAIEKHYGRNLPQECLERDFNMNRHDVLGKAFSHRHACEQYGPSFTHILDSKEIDKFISDRHMYKPQVTAHAAIFDKRATNMSDYRHSGGNRSDRDREVSSRRDRHRHSDRDIASHSRPSVRHSSTAASTSYASALDNTALDPVDDETHRRMVESFLKGTLKKSTSDRHVSRRSSRDRKRSASPVSSSYIGYGGANKRPNLSPIRKKDIWWEYSLRIDDKLKDLDDKYRGYRNDPESHPMYNEEWQKFWKRRKDELITAGLDHRKYNYQPEWVRFFKVRVKELFTQEVENMKIKLREKMHLPMTNDYLSDPTYHVQAPKRSSPMPLNNSILMNTFQSQNIPTNTVAAPSAVSNSAPQVVSVLRLMTALEEHLGSLGPKITNLLSKALQTEKFNPQNVNSIILTAENWSLIETAKEKFKGLVLAGIYDGSKQRALNKVIEEAESLLSYAEKLRINQPIGPQSTILNNFNQASVVPPILPLQINNATLQSGGAVRSCSGFAAAESNLNSSFLRPAAQIAFEQHQSPSNYQATNMRSSVIEQSTTLSGSSPRTQLSLDKEDLSAKLALILSAQSKTDFDPDTIQKLGAIVNMIEKKKREGHTISAKKKSLSDMLTDLLKNASARNEVTTEQSITLDEPLSNRQTAAVPTPNINMTNTHVSGGRLSTANINSSYHNKPSTSSSGEKTFSGGNYYNTTTTSTNLNNSNLTAGRPSGRFVYNNNAPNNLAGYQPQLPTQQPQRFPTNSGPYNNGPYQANNANQYQAAWNMNYLRPPANAMGGSGIPRDNLPPWPRY